MARGKKSVLNFSLTLHSTVHVGTPDIITESITHFARIPRRQSQDLEACSQQTAGPRDVTTCADMHQRVVRHQTQRSTFLSILNHHHHDETHHNHPLPLLLPTPPPNSKPFTHFQCPLSYLHNPNPTALPRSPLQLSSTSPSAFATTPSSSTLFITV